MHSKDIDELQSSLFVHEQKLRQQDKDEQSLKASTSNQSLTPNRTSRGRGRGRGRGLKDHRNQQQQSEHHIGDSQGRRGHGRSNSTTHRSSPGDKSNIECYRCHRYGHYKYECRTNLSKNNGVKSHFAEKDEKEEEEISLLMVCHAKEESNKNLWYLDTGCNNLCVGTSQHSL